MNDHIEIQPIDELLVWVQNWYSNQCDSEWEHGYGIHIDTIDNPGWRVKISLKKTPLENRVIGARYIWPNCIINCSSE